MTQNVTSDLNLKPPRKGFAARLARVRAALSGLLPLFLLAHFGTHVVGSMLIPLLPEIRTTFNLDYATAGLLVSIYSVVGGVAQLPAGWLADRIGSRLLILLSTAGVAAGGILIGMSRSYGMLIIVLALTSLLTGGYHPAASRAISMFTPFEKRGRALGLHLIGGTASFWAVPLLAAPMLAALTWRGPFIILTIPIIALGIALFFILGRRLKAPVQTAEAEPHETTEKDDKLKIRWRVLLPFLVLTVGTGMITMSIAAYYSLYAADQLKVPPEMVLLLMAITPAVGVFVAPIGGYLSDRFGAIPVVAYSSLMAGPLMYAMGQFPNVAIFGVLLGLIGMANMLRSPASEAYFVTRIPARRRGSILGIYFFAGAGIAGLMTPLAGVLIDARGFGPTLFGAAILQTVLTIICMLFLRGWKAAEAAQPAT